MVKRVRVGLIVVLVAAVLLALAGYLHGANIEILNPKGPIAAQEKRLIIFALLLSLIVVIPVFAMTLGFAWRYREGNERAKYSPNLQGNRLAETIWWLVPSALIAVLAVVAWNSSHTLDPYRPLVSNTPAMTIQVVALDWKWLFIYPQAGVATVNYVQIPERTPVNFEITADAPMNSFWIPQLAGQIYAMPGMSTQLHLSADGVGSYRGLSANISGEGFSGMTFVAKSSTKSDFESWLATAQQSSRRLTMSGYNHLAAPSQNNAPATYTLAAANLYSSVIDKYMPASTGMAMQ
jgi:cytochrome o ubiquinol oxidase subunit 2